MGIFSNFIKGIFTRNTKIVNGKSNYLKKKKK